MFSRFYRNFEVYASEFLENLNETCLRYYIVDHEQLLLLNHFQWFAIFSIGYLLLIINLILVSGKNFAVFRAEDGTAHVIGAYCPHLGANLAAGGRVFGNCLECPFHGWRFRGEDGKCTSIPYAEKSKWQM